VSHTEDCTNQLQRKKIAATTERKCFNNTFAAVAKVLLPLDLLIASGEMTEFWRQESGPAAGRVTLQGLR
jgi:P2-related tail formation protein